MADETAESVVPAAGGSTVDIIPRIVFEQLATQLGQSIIVENRGGAGTTIGSGAVAKADPDGYTILVNSSARTIAPSLYADLSYHPARDFAAVIPLGVSPSVLGVPQGKGFRTAAEFVAAAKAKPGGMNFSSVGAGSATHLSAERFKSSAGVQAVHVPFKGGAEAMTEVIAGRIDFFFEPEGLVIPQVKDSSLLRWRSIPPSVLQRCRTCQPRRKRDSVLDPREIIDKLHRETLKALQEPKVRDKVGSLGVDPMVMTSQEFDAHVKEAIASDAALVKATGLKVQ